jgi:hypothetical protein
MLRTTLRLIPLALVMACRSDATAPRPVAVTGTWHLEKASWEGTMVLLPYAVSSVNPVATNEHVTTRYAADLVVTPAGVATYNDSLVERDYGFVVVQANASVHISAPVEVAGDTLTLTDGHGRALVNYMFVVRPDGTMTRIGGGGLELWRR